MIVTLILLFVSSDSNVDELSDEWMLDDDLISGSLCVCGSLNRAHKAYCPMNSRNRSIRVLFGADDVLPAPSSNLGHSKCGESDDTIESDKDHMCKKDHDSVELKPGDCVFVQSRKVIDSHVPCRIVQVVGKFYRLCSKNGVLSGRYSSKDLTL